MKLLAVSTAASGWAHHAAYLPGVDPRLRIAAVALAASLTAVVDSPGALAIAAVAAVVAVATSGLGPGVIAARLLPLNAIMLVLTVTLPLTTPGQVLATLGPLQFSQEGLLLAALIAAKGNIIVLMMAALLGSIDATTLGHALSHLHVPDKLAHLLLFTVRYLDVLHHEYQRLRAVMKVRGFRPAMNLHTYRSLGHLAGMLLVRSFDRAERVVAAMKCRGFRGHFYLLDHFAMSRRDWPFGLAVAAVATAMTVLQWR